MIASENNLQTTDCPDMRKNIYPQYVKNSPKAHVYLALCIMLLLLFQQNESTKYLHLQSDVRSVKKAC